MSEPNSDAAIAVGTVLPALTIHLTRADLVRYAGASGDFNPIHWSDRAATALGLDGVLAHGMLTMGTALRVVTDWIGDPGRVVAYSTRFTKPVFVPDDDAGAELRFTGTVASIDDDTATVSIEAVCVDRAGVDGTGAGIKVLGAARVEVRL